jgi:signal transduction histidine kinase
MRKSLKVLKAQESDDDFSTLSKHIENERSRIASDLHDELGALMSVMNIHLECVIEEASSFSPLEESRLIEIRRNLHLLMESIRRNIWKLSAQMFDQVDLAFSLRELCHKFDQQKVTRLAFIQTGTGFQVGDQYKLNLFRMTQELLTNATKHSSAENISVHLHWGDNQTMSITVEDDGVGYFEKPATDGIGLLSMAKRAAHINASIQKEALEKGQRVTISLRIS